ncbi:MAG TPA: superinfection immunity protein [Chthoniobacterales bacterium]|nr:superinfection immunity protein [Chthoniobacterales bacterium]
MNGIKITDIFVGNDGRDPALPYKITPFPIGSPKIGCQKADCDSPNLKHPIMLAYFPLSAASANFLPTISNSWLIAGSLTTIYFAPALVAFFRKQQNRWFILVLNFLFGWTIAGWIICLAWAALAPAGKPVVVVQTVPPVSSGPMSLFRRRFSALVPPPGSNASENVAFQTEDVFLQRRPRSFQMVLFRLAVAAISLAVIAGVTASRWKDSHSVSLPKHRMSHVPQIQNIDPSMPSPPSAALKRRYPSTPARSHEGYY